MTTGSFHLWWVVSCIVLLVIAAAIGRTAKLGMLGIPIDHRKRYSLTHLQTVLWTITILSSVIAVFIASGFDPDSIQIPSELLGLMGISAGSAVMGTTVKGMKDASNARVVRNGVLRLSGGGTKNLEKQLAQIWLEEEGDHADEVISITKFQNFIFTLVILVVYISLGWKSSGLPVLPENIVWLIGVSHAGYVGGKVPNKM